MAKANSESKDAAFRRLANYRVNKALDRIRKIGHLANRANYNYTAEQVDAVFGSLERELATQRQRFAGQSEAEEFQL